ncbi:MAG: ASCH domain-containing protein [Rhizobiaceae bacterium]
MKGLVIDEPWVSLIMRGEKSWEMRKTGCNYRGPVALIRKGSGQVVGVADVVGSLPPIDTRERYRQTEAMHRIPPSRQEKAFADGWRTPWVLANARPLSRSVSYRHPYGAVIWVTLDPKVISEISGQLSESPVALREENQPQSAFEPVEPVSSAEKRSAAAPRREVKPTGARGQVSGCIDGDVAYVSLTQGNITHNHFYLRSILDFFPDSAIGGSDRSQAAKQLLTVQFVPGGIVRTDISGPNKQSLEKRSAHYFFRDRSPIKTFFARSNAKPGDTVAIRRDGLSSYTITLEKTGLA